MDAALYPQMANLEEVHWWFVARRAILDKLLASLKLSKEADILEAGCGTGGNLPMLARYGRVHAMELDDTARAFAQQRGCAEVLPGHLPDDIPFQDRSFDLIALFDVLEHLEDDAAALRALRAHLKPHGQLLITVPAYMFLWSGHDETHHHYRRYVLNQLRDLVANAGYKIRYASYFNTLLFPLIATIRLLKNLLQNTRYEDLALPPPWLNKLLTTTFASERHLIERFRFPFGVSLVLLAERKDN